MPLVPWSIPRVSIRTLVVSAVALALAWFSGWAALALALADPAPATAARSPIAAGPALGALSRLLVVLSVDPRKVDPNAIFPKEIPAKSVVLAKKAFRKEPMSTDALVVLALAANASGNASRSQALFQSVNRLTRRSGLTSMWLAEKALQARNIDATLLHFDEILRTTENGRSNVLQRFAPATADPVFSRALAKLLRSNPPWTDEFWHIAPTVAGTAKSVGELRLQMASARHKFDPVDDSALAAQLVEAGEYDLANRFYVTLAPPPESASGERVRNWQFEHQSVLPPVDWSISSTGDFGAEIHPAAGALVFSAIGSTRARVARQWIGLTPGHYMLMAKLSFAEQGGGEAGEVDARLTCVGKDQFHDFALKDGLDAQTFVVPSGGCRNYWLDIMVQAGEGSTGLDGSLDFISVKPG